MKIAVILPTYNERENIGNLIKIIFDLNIAGLEIIVIDDNSPDGTSAIVNGLKKDNSNIHLISREGKLGLGTAYLGGFRYALERGAEYILGMDADFSHDPKLIPSFLAQMNQFDLAVGSRYIPKGKIENWNIVRQIISRFGNLYARSILGMPVHDLTTGYKCYRREVIKYLLNKNIDAIGYVFLTETTYYTLKAGYKVKEIPIVFTERRSGKSKFSWAIIWESFCKILKLRFTNK